MRSILPLICFGRSSTAFCPTAASMNSNRRKIKYAYRGWSCGGKEPSPSGLARKRLPGSRSPIIRRSDDRKSGYASRLNCLRDADCYPSIERPAPRQLLAGTFLALSYPVSHRPDILSLCFCVASFYRDLHGDEVLRRADIAAGDRHNPGGCCGQPPPGSGWLHPASDVSDQRRSILRREGRFPPGVGRAEDRRHALAGRTGIPRPRGRRKPRSAHRRDEQRARCQQRPAGQRCQRF